jgi:hypothetical protein
VCIVPPPQLTHHVGDGNELAARQRGRALGGDGSSARMSAIVSIATNIALQRADAT